VVEKSYIDLLESPFAPFPPSSLTIGNFDGCHLGHQSLIKQTLAHQETLQLSSSLALSFDPLPEEFFRSKKTTKRLFTKQQKQRALSELSIKPLIQNFNERFSRLTYELFYQQILKNILSTAAITVGESFKFGYGRLGTPQWLLDKGLQEGLKVSIMPIQTHANQIISSSSIRDILEKKGDVGYASKLLGRPYMLEGIISKGDQLGRKLGFPTANLGQIAQLLPAQGIYAGFVWLEDDPSASQQKSYPPIFSTLFHPAVFFIGDRPAVSGLVDNEKEIRVEAHLLKEFPLQSELYGRRAGFYFNHRLRENRHFSSTESLIEAIRHDISQAKQVLEL
jgi:riboflavin kinase/FMN adenylyltransferase